MLRRLLVLALAGLCLIQTPPAWASGPPPLRGKAVLLMDGRTGQLLYQINGSERNFPASTTKLLTALVAVERGELNQKIYVSPEAVSKGPDSATCSVSQGDEEPLEYMLYGLLLRSGNDCADAIAEGLTNGNPEQFITWMNETAERIGATSSHFVNPHGLHDPNHYTTPTDLALITRAALANPVIRRIAATQHFHWPGKEKNGIYHNLLNDLLQGYPPLAAGKTGFTEQAGFTLAALAEKEGRALIGVTMGFDSRSAEFADIAALFEYGFTEFDQVEVVKQGQLLGEVQVVDGQKPGVAVMADASFAVMAPKGRAPSGVSLVPQLQTEVPAPVTPGQPLGLLEIRNGDSVLGTVRANAVEEVALQPSAWHAAGQRVGQLALWLTSTLAGLFLIGQLIRTVQLRRRRLRRAQFASRHRATGTHGSITGYRPRTPR